MSVNVKKIEEYFAIRPTWDNNPQIFRWRIDVTYLIKNLYLV